jgi:hypothetical protein
LDCNQPDCSDVTTFDDLLGWSTTDQIHTTRYGQESVDYVVSLDNPVVLFENEINFPGWVTDDPRVIPIEHDGIFRAWKLKAGSYEFTARYSAPELRRQLLLFGGGLLGWLISGAWWWTSERRRTDPRRDDAQEAWVT